MKQVAGFILLCVVSLFITAKANAFALKTGKVVVDTGNIKVYSDFPGGSVLVKSIDQVTRTIRIVPESNPDRGWECWWYFRVEGLEPGSIITFEVGANSFGLPDKAQFSYDNKTWTPLDEPGERKGRLLMVYHQKVITPVLWLAWGPPFVLRDAEDLMKKAVESSYARRFDLSATRSGKMVPALVISQKGIPEKDRPVIWVQARQHAWETGSSWVGSGFIEWLVSADPLAEEFRKSTLVYFIPLMDVDNVELGAGGKSQKPQDQNRDWSNSPYFPEVRAAMDKLSGFNTAGSLKVFIDLHNPASSDKEVFFYVPAKPLLTPQRLDMQSEFFKIAQEEMADSTGFRGKLGPLGNTYDPLTDTTSDSWVANNTNSMLLSLTMETPWNTPDGTQAGYLKRGAQLGRSIARYILKK